MENCIACRRDLAQPARQSRAGAPVFAAAPLLGLTLMLIKQGSFVDMYFNSAPTIDVVVRTEPAPWWQVLAAVGPSTIIFFAEIVWIVLLVRANRRSKTASGRDWEQMRWALDASLSEDAQRAKMGRAVLAAISKLQLSKDDREILRAATQRGPGLGDTEPRELEYE